MKRLAILGSAGHGKVIADKCYVRQEALAGWTRARIVDTINSEGALWRQGSRSELHLVEAFEDPGWRRPAERLAVTPELGEPSLMFVVHPTLTCAKHDKTCAAASQVLQAARA